MVDTSDVVRRLREDALEHVVALKMLSLYPQRATLHFIEEGSAWALGALFPAAVSEFDLRAYPSAEWLALIDGNSEGLMRGLLGALPRAELVLKTHHRAIARHAMESGDGRLDRTFVSLTTEQAGLRVLAHVSDGGELDEALARAFARYGNDVEFLSRAFRQGGARWFAVRGGGTIRSACLVYQNYAREVVAAALNYLVSTKLQPRYQVDAENFASLAVARSLGLAEFLRVEHVVLPK
jgi:hypothetical protein